jgi:hypothetical protein
MSYIIVTETLARLYEEHGVLDKAKEVYQQLHQQHPDRTDFVSKISDLDAQIVQPQPQSPTDYRETLDQGLANNQEGMPLDTALDEFDENNQAQSIPQFDPAILDQIMVMTDPNESVVPEANNMEMKIPGPMPEVSENQLPVNALPQIMHRWIDLLMMKRKIDQLKQLKQKTR